MADCCFGPITDGNNLTPVNVKRLNPHTNGAAQMRNSGSSFRMIDVMQAVCVSMTLLGWGRPDQDEFTTARVSRSGPKSLALSMERISASLVLARFTRLLMVPTAHPQICAASS